VHRENGNECFSESCALSPACNLSFAYVSIITDKRVSGMESGPGTG
jgi:hypothetical protein